MKIDRPRVENDFPSHSHAPVEFNPPQKQPVTKIGFIHSGVTCRSLSAFETGDANPNTEPPPFYAPGRGFFERGRLLRWKR